MGDNWIGSYSVICDDVTLVKGVVIGANATVTSSMPMAIVAAGSPAKIIKNRFRKNWDFHQRERASNNGMPSNIIDYVQGRGKLISELIGPTDSVLDVGCGEGIITAQIASKTSSVIGCDYCNGSVEEARKRYPNVRFETSNVIILKFPDNHFTKVIFTEVAEHLMPVQLKGALEEISRVLREDGILLLTTPVTGAGYKTSCYAHLYEYSLQEITNLPCQYFTEVKYINQRYGMFFTKFKKLQKT